jgi:hypothetical protein
MREDLGKTPPLTIILALALILDKHLQQQGRTKSLVISKLSLRMSPSLRMMRHENLNPWRENDPEYKRCVCSWSAWLLPVITKSSRHCSTVRE